MVTAKLLRLSETELLAAVQEIMHSDSPEPPVEFFASVAWSVICEPGDAFAGLLINTFGAAQALNYELDRISAEEYVNRFSEVGSDALEMQAFGRFERTLLDARERWHARMTIAKVMESIKSASACDGWFITSMSPYWPNQLEDLERHNPRGLWGLGSKSILANKSFAFVGSRMASAYGEFATTELVSPLIAKGFAIVSGGAYGIDAMAHKSALALQGSTVAVMAGGIDRLYPSGNFDLFRAISQQGCLVSEMPPGAEPTKWRFLQRNRIIAALGQATVVVEAHSKSGAVSTANRAIELGRPLGAVPGPVNSPASDGCHRLIREFDAALITCAEDILEMIGESPLEPSDLVAGLGALETRVNDVIGHQGADLQQICTEGGLTMGEAQIGIAGLLLAQVIEEDSVGWRRRH